jgi:hypothetical protein
MISARPKVSSRPGYHQPLQHDAEGADHHRHDQQRPPVADAEIVQQHPRHERAQHVLRAMGEVDDVQQAEDHGQSQRQDRIERPVDQTQQKLPEKGLRGDSQ